MIAVDFDEMQNLMRMSQRDDKFVGKIANGLLAVVESRRDAEIRAATAEANLASERGKLDAVRDVLASMQTGEAAQAEALRQISELVS